jgi:hypothetical protein
MMQKAELQNATKANEEPAVVVKQEVVAAAPSKNQPINKELQKEFQRSQKAFEKLEAEIRQWEGKKAEAERLLADPTVYADKSKFLEAEKQYAQIAEALVLLQSKYESAFELMMDLEEKLKG